MLILRFDQRSAPDVGAGHAALHSAAVDMAAWADGRPATVVVSQHHSSPDGYLSSPLLLAAAIAGRTAEVPINVGALLLLMYDPVKLAEDMIVLDHLSAGRVSYTIGLGYRDAEYAMFGVERRTRATEIEERIEVLRRCLAGERFEWRGRTIQVTPGPHTAGGPTLGYGGGTPAAAARAARHGLLFLPQSGDPTLAEAYDAAALQAGNLPGMTLAPAQGAPTSVFVSDDPERTWAEIGDHLLHDARTYAEWMGASGAASVSRAATVAELAAEQGAYRVVDRAGAREILSEFGALSLHPLCGGLAPEVAWPLLELAGEVMADASA